MPTHGFEMKHASRADLDACRALLRSGSRSFHAASLLLPARVHEPAGALYAFCRLADDEIDDADANAQGGPAGALMRLRERLDCAYAGRPGSSAVDRAFADVVRAHRMPRALPEALLNGFAWDAEGRRYETLADVLAYAARVAGAVGAMMTVLMGRRDAATVARACDLGVAMQLSNIARDVGEDARAGRLYLPLAWMREEGIDPQAWLERPEFNEGIARTVQRLLEVADSLYVRAGAGVARLPLSCRPGIGAARLLYAEIGHEVRRQGGDSISRRAVVSGRRKLALLGQSVVLAVVPRSAGLGAPLSETLFLVEAVVNATPRSLGRLGFWPGLEARAIGVIELFARMEQREHTAATQR